MDLGRYLVERHLREGTPIAELAAAHGVHRSWLYKLLARYRADGEAGLEARSRRPHRSPTRISDRFENEIVASANGSHEAASTPAPRRSIPISPAAIRTVPSVSTIWRVLTARGFVTPQPHKRPRSSYIRFVAELPNECWQMDVTHVGPSPTAPPSKCSTSSTTTPGSASPPRLPRRQSPPTSSPRFHNAAPLGLSRLGVLSDNGAVFTAATKADSTTSASAAPTPANPSPCSSPDATSGSSPKTASSSANSSSTQPATTNRKPDPDVYDDPRQQSPMPRDITRWAMRDSNPRPLPCEVSWRSS